MYWVSCYYEVWTCIISLAQNNETGSPGDFTLEWDAPNSQDIVLLRKYGNGEEIAISALLGTLDFTQETTRVVNMKVCIKKPGLSSLLQFNCEVTNKSYTGPDFKISSASYFKSLSSTGPRYYTSTMFR